MGTTTRLFFADPKRGWRRVAWVKGYFVYHGAEALPSYAEQTIVVAFAHIEIDRYRVIQLLRLERAQWRFDTGGFFDQAFALEETRRRFWPTNSNEVEEEFIFTQNEIDLIRKFLHI